jgi:hypothetical protein
VTKAGVWRLDGKIKAVNADGTYDVLLQDEGITLTNKPPEEVEKKALGRYAQQDAETAVEIEEIAGPLRTARLVRRNQSRACCTACHVLVLSMVATSVALFVHAFSLKAPIENGSCRVCGRYGCGDYPAGDPHCDELFLPVIYAASFMTAFTVVVAAIQAASMDRCRAAWLRGEDLGRYDCTWRLCAFLGWNHTLWCVGDYASSAELYSYDTTVASIRNRRFLRMFDRVTASLSRLGSNRSLQPTSVATSA